ncbi:DNA circularization protein, partial [Escherichia coli]
MTCLCIDDLRPASFRGVGFFVASDQGEYGRRGPVHEYPNRDNPYFEDLGEKAR